MNAAWSKHASKMYENAGAEQADTASKSQEPKSKTGKSGKDDEIEDADFEVVD